MRKSTVGLAAAFGACASVSLAASPLPDDVKKAINQYVMFDQKTESGTLDSLKIQSADITGDGKPEYVIETKQEGGSDGMGFCTKLLFSSVNGAYDVVDTFDCCDLQLVPAAHAKGGQLICHDPTDHPGEKVAARKPRRDVLFTWKGTFPADGKNGVLSVGMVKADFAKGKQLFGAKKYAEAEPLLCGYRQLPGDPNPEFATGCGAVKLSLGKFDDAYELLSEALVNHEDYGPLHAQLGKAAEARHSPKEAIDHYTKYLATAPPGSGRSAIEDRLRALKAASSTGSTR